LLRIAYLINSLDGYGAGLPVPMVTRFMKDAGAEVRLFALSKRDGRMEPVLADAGIGVECGPEWNDLKGSLPAMSWLKEKLSGYKPTLIWTSLVRATLAGRVMGVMMKTPVVSWQHNTFLKPANVAALALTRKLTQLWVADSQSVASVTKQRFSLADKDVAVWPLFSADNAAPLAGAAQAGAPFRLGSLGRLHPHKGYDLLIKALSELQRKQPNLSNAFTVTIGGEGPDRARLEHLARAHDLTNLTFAGYQEDARGFLASLNGYLQPSRVEGLCIAAHEAMQAGLPAIVTDVGEMPYSVRDGETGLIVPVGDPRALATAIGSLVSDRDRAAAMGAAARRYVHDRFSTARFREAGHEIMKTAGGLVR